MKTTKIDVAHYKNSLSLTNQIIRLVWGVVWPCGTWFLPRSLGMSWKRMLLRLFGAKIHSTAGVYTGVRIYYPANLTMEAHSCLADGVNCYNVAPITIGEQVTVSQEAYLCTASHDIADPLHHLVTAPITIERDAWIGARAYVGMGVTIGEGTVVGATASVYKDVEPWTVVGGNPARFIKNREIKNA